MASIRTLLVLARASNLPTVWSNCLAGWWLGGGRNFSKLPFLFGGVTALYVGGMFLNDAFDSEFDRQHRKERPIPSGDITLRAVWRWGFLLLAIGAGLLFAISTKAGVLGLVLAASIVLYDAIHKAITFSPLLMGLCRFYVYMIAAATGAIGIVGWATWCGLALAAYVIGLSFLARRESLGGPARYWPAVLLCTPILLAVFMNTGKFRDSGLLLSLALGLWMVRCLRPAFSSSAPNVGRAVSGLLAGIVFVDWLAALDAPRELGFVFLALLGCAVLFQRFVPAT